MFISKDSFQIKLNAKYLEGYSDGRRSMKLESKSVEDFYSAANSLNAIIPTLRFQTKNELDPIFTSICRCIEYLEVMARSLEMEKKEGSGNDVE